MIIHKIKKYAAVFAASLILCASVFAGGDGGFDEKNLYAGMDYKKIYNQNNVLFQYPTVLEKEGLEPVKCLEKQEVTQNSTWKKIGHKLTCNFFKKPPYDQSKKDDDFNKNEKMSTLLNESEIVVDEKTSDDLDQALVKDYQTKKASAMKRSLVQPLFSLIVDGSSFGAGSILLPSGFGSGFSSFVLLNVVADNIKTFSKAFYSIYVSPLGDPLEPYEILYAKRKRFLSSALQEIIENKFGVARKSEQSMDQVLDFLSIALNLPLKSKKLTKLTSSAEKVKELFSGYSENVAKDLMLKFFSHSIRYSSKYSAHKDPKSVVYLQGPPGVGKTYITEQLAKFMDAPLIKLTALENIESVIGTENSTGSLLQAIARPEVYRNAIILIDEIDHVVNKENSSLQLFLPLLEPDTKYFYSPYLKTYIDISHFCFVLAGNSELKNEALKSRCTTIVIDDISPKKKTDIINTMVTKKESKNNDLMNGIKKLIENDKEKGVRKLRATVNDLINQYRLEEKIEIEIKENENEEN